MTRMIRRIFSGFSPSYTHIHTGQCKERRSGQPVKDLKGCSGILVFPGYLTVNAPRFCFESRPRYEHVHTVLSTLSWNAAQSRNVRDECYLCLVRAFARLA